MRPSGIRRFLLIQSLVLLGLSLLPGVWTGNSPLPRWFWRPLDLLWAAAGTGFLVGLAYIWIKTWPAYREAERFTDQLMAGITAPWAILLALASGLREEFFFRGYLQNHLGIILTGILFGLAHTISRRLWAYPVSTFIVGLILGFLYQKTGNLLVPALMHIAFNLIELRRRATPGLATSA